MIVYAPMNEIDLQNILYTVQLSLIQPIAIRYPRGRGVIADWKMNHFGNYKPIEIGKAKCLKSGTKTAILSTGTIGNNVVEGLNKIENNDIAHYDFGFVKPLDEKLLHEIFSQFETIFTIEDGTIIGGFGTAILEFAAQNNYHSNIKILGIPDNFIEQGTVSELQQICGIDVEGLVAILNKF
jgi:1-deoxy-D-xylulose-5-phosphate synthase